MQEYSNPNRINEPTALPDIEIIVNEDGCYYWWSCFPGCLPDSDPIGPFDTYEDALAAVQDYE